MVKPGVDTLSVEPRHAQTSHKIYANAYQDQRAVMVRCCKTVRMTGRGIWPKKLRTHFRRFDCSTMYTDKDRHGISGRSLSCGRADGSIGR